MERRIKAGSSKKREITGLREGKGAPGFCKLTISTRTAAG